MPPSHLVYLALGSNLGRRAANLQSAIQALAPMLTVRRLSSVYQTEPWGYADQPAFLNQALAAQTALPPLDLLSALKQLESRLGRQPAIRYGPRLIDLDILFYDDLVLDHPNLTIPHPRLPERAFVLVPLAEIAPTLRHPLNGRTVAEMLAALDPRGVNLYPGEAPCPS